MDCKQTKMNLYLSGPLSAKTDKLLKENIEVFARKAYELRELGHTVFNPTENEPPNKSWEWYMARDVDVLYKGIHKQLLWFKFRRKFNAIYMMKGWEDSLGARFEKQVAILLKLKIIYEICHE